MMDFNPTIALQCAVAVSVLSLTAGTVKGQVDEGSPIPLSGDASIAFDLYERHASPEGGLTPHGPALLLRVTGSTWLIIEPNRAPRR